MGMVSGMSDLVFWLIRHAESTWNAAGRWQGHADPPLTPRGREQAAQLAVELEGSGIELLVASDLARTRQTAAILGEQLGLEPRHDPGLREIDAGLWSGLSRAEIAETYAQPLARFDSGDPDAPAGEAETRRQASSRVRRVLAGLGASRAGAHVAVVTHSGVIESLLPGSRVGHAAWTVARAETLLSASGAAER